MAEDGNPPIPAAGAGDITPVGFIGLGNQGAPIARRIAAAFPSQIWARRPEAFQEVPAAKAVSDLPELARACKVIGICVSGDADVVAVTDVIGAHMAPGGAVMIHSTIAPETVQSVAASLAERGIAVVDAPVSGGPIRAERGEMTVMIGASPADDARVRPIIESFANTIVRLGGPGSAQMMKLINNGLFFANATAAASALRLADELGLDRAGVAQVIGTGTGGSTAFHQLDMANGGLDTPRRHKTINKDLSHVAALGQGHSEAAQLFIRTGARFLEYVPAESAD